MSLRGQRASSELWAPPNPVRRRRSAASTDSRSPEGAKSQDHQEDREQRFRMMPVAVREEMGHEDPGARREEEERQAGEQPHQREEAEPEGRPVEDGEGRRVEEGFPREDGREDSSDELRVDELVVLPQEVDVLRQVGKEPDELRAHGDDPADREVQGGRGRKPPGVPAIQPAPSGANASPPGRGRSRPDSPAARGRCRSACRSRSPGPAPRKDRRARD